LTGKLVRVPEEILRALRERYQDLASLGNGPLVEVILRRALTEPGRREKG